ncbi:hypothetical protein MIND_00258800 [Mycena indigotica]|uniref:Fe2OG dioxygenase domain-containing protein n=1 Tax=Mycena indigotica TaxID=2126181 RepID=A0A8H6WF26_9AGAR|nr:uncharacterized protein MIND_00258800 [Mycena indigotica]KAF7312453.1 hypothetical protein MIND_00258800 [Mycena indigotica]
MYAPPPGPPPTLYNPPPGPPPLTHSSPALPQDASELSTYVRQNLTTLASQGWLSLPLPPDLEELYSALFSRSAEYFSLPTTASDKTRFAAPTGADASDEGFFDIPEEKQLITIRRQLGMPSLLRDASNTAWNATGHLFLDTMHNIAESLELEDDLGIFDDMCIEAGGFEGKDRASSLLRLFRYDRPPTGSEKRIVAEGHKDLGLLTLVVGSSPGLDARDANTGEWISVEDGANSRLTATLLSGQTLTYLTRNLFAAGPHRVSVLPPSSSDDPYRFSLVFALRPAPLALISTSRFARSPLVGPFPEELLSYEKNNYPACSMDEQPAKELFRCISKMHWNVNIAPETREKQRRNLRGEGVNNAAEIVQAGNTEEPSDVRNSSQASTILSQSIPLPPSISLSRQRFMLRPPIIAGKRRLLLPHSAVPFR